MNVCNLSSPVNRSISKYQLIDEFKPGLESDTYADIFWDSHSIFLPHGEDCVTSPKECLHRRLGVEEPVLKIAISLVIKNSILKENPGSLLFFLLSF